jgi:hypothetical protein
VPDDVKSGTLSQEAWPGGEPWGRQRLWQGVALMLGIACLGLALWWRIRAARRSAATLP